ncbi:MAG: hypothetical protein PWQ57_3439 [Desulfovibrionales bacterium]|jgi:uncharacterized protein YbjQ (UPF0145 family)|nr:hypothetical protein [Desulfovibrionales bacterium]
MALLFGSPARRPRSVEDSRRDQRIELARDAYQSGKLKIVTTEDIPNREVQWTFGLIVCRSFSFDKAFYGLISQILDVNADAIVGYREHVAFHPDGDKFFSCYGTAVRLKPKK